jgi:hypothetical protein
MTLSARRALAALALCLAPLALPLAAATVPWTLGAHDHADASHRLGVAAGGIVVLAQLCHGACGIDHDPEEVVAALRNPKE